MKSLRCYDNQGKTFDRYTIIFTRKISGIYYYITSSDNPTHPQGFYQHGESTLQLDEKHLGKKIPFSALPEKVRACVREDALLAKEQES